MSTVPSILQIVWRFAFAFAAASLIYWLGVRHALRHPEARIPPRPTICAFCGGQLRSELVWSSVCRTCNRGQIGHYPPMDLMAEAKKRAPPFVSHVDVAARHASDSPGGYPWRHL